jgi:hypothetical protein
VPSIFIVPRPGRDFGAAKIFKDDLFIEVCEAADAPFAWVELACPPVDVNQRVAGLKLAESPSVPRICRAIII